MNVLWISHVILTPLATTQWDRSIVHVIKDTKEMEPTAQVWIISYIIFPCLSTGDLIMFVDGSLLMVHFATDTQTMNQDLFSVRIHPCGCYLITMSQRHQSVRCKPVLRIRGFAIVQTTRYDIHSMESQLWDRQSGVGIEPFTFELETGEPNPLACSDVFDLLYSRFILFYRTFTLNYELCTYMINNLVSLKNCVRMHLIIIQYKYKLIEPDRSK